MAITLLMLFPSVLAILNFATVFGAPMFGLTSGTNAVSAALKESAPVVSELEGNLARNSHNAEQLVANAAPEAAQASGFGFKRATKITRKDEDRMVAILKALEVSETEKKAPEVPQVKQP